MTSRREFFVRMSASLTGYSRVELFGTGSADLYLDEIDKILSRARVEELLAAYSSLPEGDDAVGLLLEDELWGPLARNVITLWYCGRWAQLPQPWREAHGASDADTDHVVSPEAYVSGLQWAAAGAHPAGARQQGFAAWAAPPQGTLP